MRLDYDATPTGRETYVTASGRELERRYFYYSLSEWRMLYALSQDKGVSLGKMLKELAYAERDRLQFEYQRRIDAIK